MIAHKHIVKDLGRILFWFPLRWMVQMTPMHLVYRVGGWLGELDYRISGSGRISRMRGNIISALGLSGSDARRIVRQNLKLHMRNNLELMKYPKISRSQLHGFMTFVHRERLDEALRGGNGVIVMTAHFGAKQLLQIALGLHGYPANQIHYHMGHDELTFVQKYVAQCQRVKIEEKIPAKFIPANGFLRSAFKCLRSNQVLIMAGDGIGLKHHMDKSYQPFDFLGRRMRFPNGPAAIARRTQAALLPAFVVRRGVDHRIVFERPLKVSRERDADTTTAYVRLLEGYVRQHPRQWEYWEEFDENVLLDG